MNDFFARIGILRFEIFKIERGKFLGFRSGLWNDAHRKSLEQFERLITQSSTFG
jgi:hypothetical protein